MPWAGAAKRPGSFATPVPQIAKYGTVLPPIGINQVDPLANMPATDAVFMYNMVAARWGTRLRTGSLFYRPNGSVIPYTLIPYNGSVPAKDRLFGAGTGTPGNAGIYDYTTPGLGVPTVELAFPGNDPASGRGIWCAMTTIGGLFTTYFDEVYGAYRYTEATDTWVKTTGAEITGVDPANLVFGMIYKSRLWCIERNTNNAWFLPTGAVIGAATLFNFGNKFKHGGTLQALYNWSWDGVGLDDYLVAISSAGDVVIYKGNDPTSPTDFVQVGVWFVGAVPTGRRIAAQAGSDLYILSCYGIQPISKLIQGSIEQTDSIELSRKITPLIKNLMSLLMTTWGWEVKFVPSEQALYIFTPQQIGQPNIQLVLTLNNQGWSVYQNLGFGTLEMWNQTAYMAMGAATNNFPAIVQHTGNSDYNSTQTGGGNAIVGYVLTSFQDAGEQGVFHQAKFARPVFLSSISPSYAIEVRYDYNLSEIIPPSSGNATAGTLWDVALWDVGVWAGGSIEIDNPRGVGGIGRAMAVLLAMQSTQETTLVRVDVAYDSGGFL